MVNPTSLFGYNVQRKKNQAHIPFTNQVRGLYCKLRTEFFLFRSMAQAQSARAINPSGKNEDP